MEAWNKVSKMSSDAMKSLQETLLQGMLQKEIPRHPYYARLFQEKDIDLSRIKRTGDLQQLPFTYKEDMCPSEDLMKPWEFFLEAPSDGGSPEEQKKRGGLLGGLLKKKKTLDTGTDPDLLSQLYYTGGRRATKPVPLVFTAYDIANLKEMGHRAFQMWGFTREETVINAFSYMPHISFWQQFYTTMELGSTALQTGGGRILGAEKILKALQNLEAQVLLTFPGYADFLLKSLRYFDIEIPDLETIVLGMDDASMSLVERLKLGMKNAGTSNQRIRRVYFLSEAKGGWPECAPGYGYHVHPDHALVEIVDPETGEAKGEEEPGEVVVTNLDARGTVVLRLRSGDLATGGITYRPCPNCGSNFPRILGDLDRLDYIFELSDSEEQDKFNFNRARRRLHALAELNQWYLEILKGSRGDELKLYFSPVKGLDEEEAARKAKEEIQQETRVPVSTERLSMENIIQRQGMEKKITEERISDMRPSK